MRTKIVVMVTVACALGGCFAHVEDHCRGCAIVHADRPSAPPVPEDARALVVLVHGAFGFGREWDPVLAALRQRPELAYFAFEWRGPLGGKPPDPADGFLEAMQLTVDRMPRSVREVLILAHSAGGGLADYAVRRLNVPRGVRVRVALLDPKAMLAPYQPLESIEMPFGSGAGVGRVLPPPLPDSVAEGWYRAVDPPRHVEAQVNPDGGERVYYIGRHVTHGGAVGLVSLPLIDQLATRTAQAAR